MIEQDSPAFQNKIARERLVERLKKYRFRKCLSMHECCLCQGGIKYGDGYYDGGYGRRAHVECVSPPTKESQ